MNTNATIRELTTKVTCNKLMRQNDTTKRNTEPGIRLVYIYVSILLIKIETYGKQTNLDISHIHLQLNLTRYHFI